MGRYFRISTMLGLIFAAANVLLPIPSFALELRSIEQAAADYRSPNERLQDMFRAALLDTSRLAEYAPDGTAYLSVQEKLEQHVRVFAP